MCLKKFWDYKIISKNIRSPWNIEKYLGKVWDQKIKSENIISPWNMIGQSVKKVRDPTIKTKTFVLLER